MSSGTPEVFRRFGDIPGLSWTTLPGVDRSSLLGHDTLPVETSWDTDDVYWPVLYPRDEDELDEGAMTSAPPLNQRPEPAGPLTMSEELMWFWEGLELPASPDGYHFLISASAERLYKLRLREPAAVGEAEKLCLLEVDLLRARPEILALDDTYDENPQPLWSSAIRLLYRIYAENGNLADAERVGVMAVHEFGQLFDRQLTETRERLLVLESEDA